MRRSLIAGGMVLVLILSACSSSFDDAAESEPESVGLGGELLATDDGSRSARVVLADEVPALQQPHAIVDARVIRDGRVDLRVEPGTFAQISAQLRSIAEDLGGYVSSGQSHLETIDDVDYAVGWFTLRVPEPRFEDALARAEALGDRVSLNVSSEDVSEEYVDLEGRLSYWKSQERFYLRLMDEATEIEDLVTIQARMQDVLLNIEQIEGRLRYLDSRTEFSTLTVGLTEVPGATPVVDPEDPGIITEALEQAGTVLLSTVGLLIVAAAFMLPVAIVGAVAYGVWRGISGGRKDPEPAEA